MECRYCKVTDRTNPYWANLYECSECSKKRWEKKKLQSQQNGVDMHNHGAHGKPESASPRITADCIHKKRGGEK